jgi:hypothetical protein
MIFFLLSIFLGLFKLVKKFIFLNARQIGWKIFEIVSVFPIYVLKQFFENRTQLDCEGITLFVFYRVIFTIWPTKEQPGHSGPRIFAPKHSLTHATSLGGVTSAKIN